MKNKTKPDPIMKSIDTKEEEPVYTNDKGEPIDHVNDSLYDEVILYFSRIGTFLDILEGFNPKESPLNPEMFFFSFAELGRSVLKDVEAQFNEIYGFIENRLGDIRFDRASYGQKGIKGDTLLGVEIFKPKGPNGQEPYQPKL